MSLRQLFPAIALLAGSIVIAPASAAEGPNGFVDGAYSRISEDGHDADDLGLRGSITGHVGPSVALEGGVSYHNTDFGGGLDSDTWLFDGAAVFHGMQGLVGAGVGYHSVDVANVTVDGTEFGIFGQYYVGPMLTVHAAGLMDDEGEFGLEGGLAGYLMPNLMIGGRVAYEDAHEATMFAVEAELLPFEAMPVSVFGGFARAEEGSHSTDIFSIGLRFYIGSEGTLANRHRTGPSAILSPF